MNRIARNSRFSMRAFARDLQLQPSALSQILSGKRSISDRLVNRIFSKISLTPKEQMLFLVSLANTKQQSGFKRISPKLKLLLKKQNHSSVQLAYQLSTEKFSIIADWYHYAILELTQVEGFISQTEWIAVQLGLQTVQVELAIDRLVEVGLLKWDNNHLVKAKLQYEVTDKHITTLALRVRQRQILEKSILSLEQDPIETRKHSAMTLAIDPDRLDEAKSRIDHFIQELTAFLEGGKQKKVYELLVNLFPLQPIALKGETS